MTDKCEEDTLEFIINYGMSHWHWHEHFAIEGDYENQKEKENIKVILRKCIEQCGVDFFLDSMKETQ